MPERDPAAEARAALDNAGVTVSDADIGRLAMMLAIARPLATPPLESEPQLIQVPSPWPKR